MRILADENVPFQIVAALRRHEHDVLTMQEISPAASDETVLDQAIREDRVLLTFDTDFGRMIFHEGHAPPNGVIFVRSPPPTPEEAIERVVHVANLETPAVDGHFVAVGRTTRYHPLPRRGA